MSEVKYLPVPDMKSGQLFFDDEGYLWRKADGCWAVRIAGGKPWIFSRFAKWKLSQEQEEMD